MIGFYNYTTWLTYLGTLSGLTGILFAFTEHPAIASLCLLFCGLCDMFDGKVASLKKDRTDIQKRFGIQLDSLSDLICFGVLPASIAWSIGIREWYLLPFLALYALSALIRLAYFNVAEEERQKVESGRRHQYNGLPVTTTAAIMPLVYCLRLAVTDGNVFRFIYFAVLLVCGAAFLIREIKIKKPGMKFLIGLLFVGIAIGAVIIFYMLKYGTDK